MYLYVGTNHHVVAIDLKDGSEVWRTRLPDATFVVGVLEVDGRVIAGSGGYVHALDARTGKLLWSNELKDLGFNPVSLAAAGRSSQMTATSGTVFMPIVT